MSYEPDWKAVGEEEAKAFVKAYPRPLEWNVTAICDPPLGNYNDFTLGNWPESMVVKVVMDYELGSGKENRKLWRWFVKLDISQN